MRTKHINWNLIITVFIFTVIFLMSGKAVINVSAQDYDSKLDIAYNYLNSGKTSEAIKLFSEHLESYPTDMKIYLQLGYAYKQIGNIEKAKENFTFVTLRSSDSKEVYAASVELDNFKSANQTNTSTNNIQSTVPVTTQETITTTNLNASDDDLLNQGYSFMNKGENSKAVDVFERYKLHNPDDIKIYMQLGYLYSGLKRNEKALENFQYVEAFSTKSDDIDKANNAIYNLRQIITANARQSLNIYFYNAYDSYYQNYISNFLGHINFKLSKNVTDGFYVDAFMDSKSKQDYILDDRYIEVGGFLKMNFSENIGFEIRGGYAREIDLNKNSFVVKPILFMGTRLGEPAYYLGRKNFKTEYFYMDIYSAELYDSKFKNLFGQIQLKEVLRYMTGGYSYLEFYLSQSATGDSRQLDYNNYAEIGIGMDFKPNLVNFPALFIEATNKIYAIGSNGQFFEGPLKNTFQIKAGFIINFNTGLGL